MDFLKIVLEQLKGFFGIDGLIGLIESGDYNSLLTYPGITSVIAPVLPVILVLEFPTITKIDFEHNSESLLYSYMKRPGQLSHVALKY